jgi:hypothetical protein
MSVASSSPPDDLGRGFTGQGNLDDIRLLEQGGHARMIHAAVYGHGAAACVQGIGKAGTLGRGGRPTAQAEHAIRGFRQGRGVVQAAFGGHVEEKLGLAAHHLARVHGPIGGKSLGKRGLPPCRRLGQKFIPPYAFVPIKNRLPDD